jgi:uncharacterized membrane protein YeiH
MIFMDSEQVIYGLDLFGIAVFAVSGSLAAGKKRMDIFGVIVLGLVTALGGGTLRDTLLDVGPVFWVDDPVYLLVATGSSLLTFIIVRVASVPWRGLLISDAFGLAVFMAIGTSKGLTVTGSASVAVVMGVMTGVAGGMIRDVLSAEVPLILRREIYATAALCGALIFVLMDRLGFPGVFGLVLSASVTLAIRIVAIQWGISLPVFKSKEDINPAGPPGGSNNT